jgi:predicted regulator of Ras-like GTPase activity (Roadblock/LC7/MglB family)
MKQLLDPLLHVPGVRAAGFIGRDGLSVAWTARPSDTNELTQDLEGLGALASGWIAELTRSSAPLSWDAPVRAVLRAARGTLIVQEAPRLYLVVLIDGGASAEDLRLPMEACTARLARHMKSLDGGELRDLAPALPRQPNASIPPAAPLLEGSEPAHLRMAADPAQRGE